MLEEGGVAIFGIADLANFWFGFLVFAHKTTAFRCCCLAWFEGLLQFSLCFSVFVNNDGSFLDFRSIQCTLQFFRGLKQKTDQKKSSGMLRCLWKIT